MVEVVPTQQPAPATGFSEVWSGAWGFIGSYWWLLLLFAIIIGLVIVVISIYWGKEENDRRRDSAVYATAMDHFESARQNANDEFIRKKYSLLNLLWLGIPFKWREHSVKLVDIDRRLLGYYRGDVKTQDGDTVYLLYKKKKLLGLVEDKFLLYCPSKINVRTESKKNNKFGKEEIVIEIKPHVLPKMLQYDKSGNEISVRCNTILRHGRYYYFPNYVVIHGDNQSHFDMTEHISKQIAKVNHTRVMETAYSDYSRALGKAIEVNPLLRYNQKEPEKEREVDDGIQDPTNR